MDDAEPTTEQLRTVQAQRAAEEAAQAEDAVETEDERAHARRSDKAAYLAEKLSEQADSQQ